MIICQALAENKVANAVNYADIMLAMEFTEWLLNWLYKKGWNQSELATRAGVTRTAISDVLSGRRNPGPDLCTAIARALNLPPETIFRAAGLLPPAPEDTEYQDEFFHLLSQLSPQERQEILELLRFKVDRKVAKIKKSREAPARNVLKRQ